MNAAPPLTIGLPVYNGENYLTASLDALLAQTFGDFELVISDNASTDATEEICRRYAEQDGRIRYIRQPRNIGAAPNHNVLVDEARGRLFKWAAHDDLYAPGLLAGCLEALQDHPEAVLAGTDMAIVDEAGEVVEKYDYRLPTDSPHPHERFKALLYTHGGDDGYGVIRTHVLRRIEPIGGYHHAARRQVAVLSLHGPFQQVRETLYFRRDHPGRGENIGSIQAYCARLDPRREGQSAARLVAEYAASYVPGIRRAPLSSAERRRCYAVYAGWLAGHLTLPKGDR
jgi:glycosyltransferase involved in cell wall biosynthesis